MSIQNNNTNSNTSSSSIHKFFHQVLPNLTLKKCVGEGAFSQVYYATTTTKSHLSSSDSYSNLSSSKINYNHHPKSHNKLDEKVQQEEFAVKVITKSSISALHMDHVIKETWIHQQLNHPNIVKLYQVKETPDFIFMVMEYMTGGELFDYVKNKGNLSEKEAKSLIHQLADVLVYLHTQVGLVHRDLKFENILCKKKIKHNPSLNQFGSMNTPIHTTITNKTTETHILSSQEANPKGMTLEEEEEEIEIIKVSDFGLSKMILHSLSTKTPCGTLGYSAPEVLLNQSYAYAVDSWSLGCILYTMLCGFPPFNGINDRELARNVARGWFTFVSPWWDEISLEAKDLVSRLLNLDPKKRLTGKQILEHPWLTGISMMSYNYQNGNDIDQELQGTFGIADNPHAEGWEIPKILKTPKDYKKTFEVRNQNNFPFNS